MSKHTEVPWRVSPSQYGAVVCDVPCRPGDKYDDHYKGFLVCESCFGWEAKQLVAAAPEMLDLLRRVVISPGFVEESILGKAIMGLLDRVETEADPEADYSNCPF